MSEDKIVGIFGYEAAEDENISRLTDYYFKSDVYRKVHNDLPLRILVGHKGIGKSATFKISYEENKAHKNIVVWIKPDDILEICDENSEFLNMIRSWKTGLSNIIYKSILENFGIKSEDDVQLFLNGSGKLISTLSEIFKKKINEYVETNSFNKEVISSFLKNNKVFVYIDDLDRGWTGSKKGVQKISALLNATRDLTNDNEGLRIRISLRTDVYYLVRTSDESTDKIEGSVIWYSWNQHELLCMLAKRVQSYYGNKMSDEDLVKLPQKEVAKYFDEVFERRFQGKGKWNNVPTYRILATMIRRRPRDLVKLCMAAARTAMDNGHTKINTEDLNANFDKYSQERLQDTINEYRSEVPEIERLLLGMKPNKMEKKTSSEFIYTTQGLMEKISKITEQGVFKSSSRKILSNDELAAFLYKINFLIARKEKSDGTIERRYFEESKYLYNSFADFGYNWEVHPAFRWALQPDSQEKIFANLAVDCNN